MIMTQEEKDRIRYMDAKLREIPYHKRTLKHIEEDIMESRIRRYGTSAVHWKTREEAMYQRGTPIYGRMAGLFADMEREEDLLKKAQPHAEAIRKYEAWKGYLTDEDRKLIELYYEQQKRTIDIGDALGMDRTTVTRNVKRVLRGTNPAVFS